MGVYIRGLGFFYEYMRYQYHGVKDGRSGRRYGWVGRSVEMALWAGRGIGMGLLLMIGVM